MIIIVSEQEWRRYVVEELAAIKSTVLQIQQKQEVFMGQVFTDLEALRTALDAATTALAAKLAALEAQITNSMTDEEVATLKEGFKEIEDSLKAMAADPADPVP